MTKQKIFSGTIVLLCLLFLGVIFAGCQKITTKSISIDESTVVTQVVKNAQIDTSGIKVYATRSDESIKEIDHEKLEFGVVDTSTVGTKDLSVKYIENGEVFTDSVEITVFGDLTGISAKAGTYVTEVVQGATYDYSNLGIVASYEGGVTMEVDIEDCTVTNINTTEIGEQTLVVEYEGQSCNIVINVIELKVTGIDIKECSVTKEVNKNDDIDTSSILVKITRIDTTTITVALDELDASDYNITLPDTSLLGEQNLTVSLKSDATITDTVVIKVFGELESIAVKDGTLAREVNLGSTLDTSGLVLIGTYEDNMTREITSGFDVGTISTANISIQELTIEYEGLSITVEINVTTDYTIAGYALPTSVINHKTYSVMENTFNKTGSTGIKGFSETAKIYKVGDDNDFIFKPVMSIRYGTGLDIQSTSLTEGYDVSLTVLRKENASFVEATDTYVTINEEDFAIKFSEEAIGKTFKIVAIPAELSVEEAEVVDAVELEIEVIDGYNVYNAIDFAILDNVNVNDKWNTLVSQDIRELSKTINGIVLHNDISITTNDIPSIHIWQDGEQGSIDAIEGSLKDTTDADTGYIYTRKVDAKETFVIEGNYFTLSAQDLPMIKLERGASAGSYVEGNPVTTHTSLLKFTSADANIYESELASLETVDIRNLQMFGNTKKTEDATLSGGIIGIKGDTVQLNTTNCLLQAWFTAYLMEGVFFDEDVVEASGYASTISKTNIYDSYSSLIYIFGCGNLVIEDSNIIGAGGPVMICDHVKDEGADRNTGTPTNVKVSNSVLESFVAGTEGWFTTYEGASALAVSIKAMNQLITPYENTLLDTAGEKMNLIAVYKASCAEGLTQEDIRGTFIDVDAKFTNGMDLVSVDAIKAQVQETIATAMNGDMAQVADALSKTAVLQTFNGAVGVPGTNGWLVSPDTNKMISAEDYLGVYLFNGMGAVLGLDKLATS